MANWCYECARKPYIGCDPQCPVFGKHFEEVAEDYFKLQADVERLKAEPVKHGRWLQAQEPLGWREVDCIECSNCHDSWVLDEDYSFDDISPWKYCPACGAKMDLEG